MFVVHILVQILKLCPFEKYLESDHYLPASLTMTKLKAILSNFSLSLLYTNNILIYPVGKTFKRTLIHKKVIKWFTLL